MQAIKNWFMNMISKVGMSAVKRKSPILKELLDNPENLKLEAYIEGEEIIFKLKKKES